MEEIKKVRNAEDARAIKNKDLITLDGILDVVSNNASFGFLIITGFVPSDIISELVLLGFKVSQINGELGRKELKIEW